MRLSIVLLFSYFAFICKSEGQPSNDYIVSGMLKNAAGTTIYLEEAPFFKELNSADSTSADSLGKFIFKGSVKEPALYILRIRGKRNLSTFILENSIINIIGNIDSMSSLRITGSKENEIGVRLGQVPEMKVLGKYYEKIFEAQVKADTSTFEAIHNELIQFYPKLNQSIKDFISIYPRAYVSVGLLNHYISLDSRFPDLKALDDANSLLIEFKNGSVSNYTQLAFLDNVIQSRLRSSVGKIAPEIIQPDTTKSLISLSSLKGKYVLIDFWASWCLPCRKENPILAKLLYKYRPRNFTILSVSLDDSHRAWTMAIKRDNMNWLNVSDLKGELNAAALNYGVKTIPDNFLIDPQGIIIAKSINGSQLGKVLDSLIRYMTYSALIDTKSLFNQLKGS